MAIASALTGYPMLATLIVISVAIGLAPVLWLQKHYEKQLGTTDLKNLFGVHQVDVISLPIPFEEAYTTCSQAIASLKFSRKIQSDQSSGTIRFHTTGTIRSYGEKILLSISEVDSNLTKITISSKPIIATTLFDYGKNAENLRLLRKAIQEAEKHTLNNRLLET